MGIIMIKQQYIAFIAASYGHNHANKLCCVNCYHFLVGVAYNLNCYSAMRLTMATQQTFLQVSQSGYVNVIDGNTSLQRWRVKITLSSKRSDFSR